jgi:serine/threonine protein kinase
MKVDEDEALADALEAMYDLDASEIEESQASELPLFASFSAEPWRYEDEILLAKGGIKEIYKAFDPKTNRFIAIAKLLEGSPQELYEPFLREARLTSFLEHPNIISIYDIGLNESSQPFFTMELKTGESFDKIIENEHEKSADELSQSSLQNLLNIFLRICDAMAYSHSKQVLHLDLKPDNIQVGHYGEVMVCDWGLGKILGQVEFDESEFERLLLNPDLLNNMTIHGEIKGTPGYIAPELLTGEKDKKSKQADIYALGALLYTLLCSESPAASANSLDDFNEKVKRGEIKTLQSYELKLPRALIAIAQKAMALSPEDRYSNVDDLSCDINSYLRGYSSTAEKSSPVYELKLFYQRNKILCRLSLLFLFVLMSSTSLYFKEIKSKELAARQALELFEIEKKEKEQMSDYAAPTHFKRAQKMLKEGDLEKAYHAAELGYLLNSDNIENQNLMGLLLFINRDYSKAAKFLDRPSLPLFEKLKKLNQLYLQRNFTFKEENKLIKDLLYYCKWILPDPLTLTLFLHWVDDPRPQVREYVADFMKYDIEDSERVLNYAKYKCDTESAKILYKKVVFSLKQKPNWLGRRITATQGAAWAPGLKMKEHFRSFIPDNLALGQKVTTSGGNEKPPEGMVDGNLAHYSEWAASPHPAHATVDLAGLHSISHIRVHFRNGGSNVIYKYKIYLSSDGTNFNVIIDQSQNTQSTRTEPFIYNFSATLARYVRIEVLHNPVNNGVHVRELEVYSD